MDIPFYVGELLYSNDCVIVPEFGGFVTHYAPAKIHPVNHTFYPPSKNILFNSQLKRDDGLLLDFIAQKQSINYAEAKSITYKFIENINEKLNGGEKVLFKNIGFLFKDIEGNILFDPDHSVNYLDDSFGLNSFVSPPIVRKSVQKRLETRFIDRKPVPEKEKKNQKKYWALVAVIPILLIVAWVISTGNYKFQNTQQTGVVSFNDPENSRIDNSLTVDKPTNPPLESLNFEEPSAVQKINSDTPLPETVKPVKKYYIIGGSFSNELNADKLVGILREKGYEAERAGISPSGLNMVSYFATEDKNEALLNLGMIRKEDNPSAWLIRQ